MMVMMSDLADAPIPGKSCALRTVIENLSQEVKHLVQARLLSDEEVEAIAIFIRDMRDQLQRLEGAETGAGDGVNNVTVAYYELEGMVKLLKSDLDIAQSRKVA